MKNLLTLAFIIIFIPSFGQINFYAGGNVTLIPTLTKSIPGTVIGGSTGFTSLTPAYTLSESYERRSGYEFGIRYSRKISDRIGIEAGIDFTSLAFKRNTMVQYSEFEPASLEGFFISGSSGGGSYQVIPVENQPIIGNMENVGETRFNYLIIPISTSYQFLNKFSVGLGVKNAILIHAREVRNQVSFSDSFTPSSADGGGIGYYRGDLYAYEITEVEDTSKTGVSTYNLMGVFSVGFNISRFEIIGSFSQGLTPIYTLERQTAGKSKMRGVSLGISYSL